MTILRSLLLALALCVAPLAHSADTETADAAQIKANIIAMWKAVENNDVEGYLDYIHEDYTLFGEGDIYLQSGKALERASYTDYLARAKNVRTFMHQPQIHVNGDTAWVIYYWSDSGYMNGERFTSTGKSTRIFVRENGKWMCIHGHFTSVG
ncbi:DUF4440 domain-containing protein [Fretibacter rubidus]|uniref:YybH family protein n=1 Tax=Fretibacter rubidus TaxID=570162 RepID=UPI00352BA25A